MDEYVWITPFEIQKISPKEMIEQLSGQYVENDYCLQALNQINLNEVLTWRKTNLVRHIYRSRLKQEQIPFNFLKMVKRYLAKKSLQKRLAN